MGVGMVVVCAPEERARIQSHFTSHGERSYEIGRVTTGARQVSLV
ncbi:MAG: AIR synthase-related protein [Pyrinomonadaceae bacterium]